MKANRRNRKRNADRVAFPTAAKGRWLPTDNTRSEIYVDRRAKAAKLACRGRVSFD